VSVSVSVSVTIEVIAAKIVCSRRGCFSDDRRCRYGAYPYEITAGAL